MPRASFNTTAGLFNGPLQSSPGDLYATVPCRFVREVGEELIRPDGIFRDAYMTLDVLVPRGPGLAISGGNEIMQFGYADRVIVASHPENTYIVMFVERVDWDGQPVYYRAHLVTIDT